MGKYIVYYTWSFIHHKLLFVTYYTFWNNKNKNNKRTQWLNCTMHFCYKPIEVNGAELHGVFFFFLMFWGNSLDSNQVYSLIIVTRNSKSVHSESPNSFWCKNRWRNSFYLYISIFIYTVNRYIYIYEWYRISSWHWFDCGYLQISVKFRNVTDKPFLNSTYVP